MAMTTQSVTQALSDQRLTTSDDSETEVREFEFTADLAVELPVGIEPKQFFEYLLRVMIAHTEAYGGSMGGETKWHPYEAGNDE